MPQESQDDTNTLPDTGERLHLDGKWVTVRMAQRHGDQGVQVAVEDKDGLELVTLTWDELAAARGPGEDGTGVPVRAITALWAQWMRWVTPRIRSAVLATTPLRPYAHQDEAVSGHMLNQPRMRLLLGDEPGTGKTIMTGMYLADARRRGLVTGKTLIVVPAHLVTKWLLDLERYFGIRAQAVTAEIGRELLPLREDVDTWVVSLDLYTYNDHVRRKLGAGHASWSLVVFDEAHRLTPTSQYLSAARDVGERSHHLLLLTATPHRGKENFFRALFNLLDPDLYPWSADDGEHDRPLRPSSLHYLRRMKETLRDHDGQPLFPPRTAEVKTVSLTGLEEDAYNDVMAYVDEWYSDQSTLARSIYGKRAASSLYAAEQTLTRRQEALKAGRPERDAHIPEGFERPDFQQANLDDEDAWDDAERAIVQATSRDRRAELVELGTLLAKLRSILDNYDPAPSRWEKALDLLAGHDIKPGHGQTLVFTEFADTAHWLRDRFAETGFTVEVLEGGLGREQRDDLQRRFLAGDFQVLVSTDAGGEGIDLQSAHVMLDWDIPWSLVRLEQRMGRLHRIGQRNAVSIYHLVAPETREGRVQAVMLQNFTLASRALKGRIFDLMDAAASQVGFNYAQVLANAQRPGGAGERAAATVPDSEQLRRAAERVAAEADRSAGPVPDMAAARERLVLDRIEAINPVMVESFIRQVAAAEGWTVSPGGARGLLRLAGQPALPEELGGTRERYVCADEDARRAAWQEGVLSARDAIVLGPAEEAFAKLVERAASDCEPALRQGAHARDAGSISDYTLMAYEAQVKTYDGVQTHSLPLPILVRYSAGQAFPVAWESVMRLEPDEEAATRPVPAARADGRRAAEHAARGEKERHRRDVAAWVEEAKEKLDGLEREFRRQLRDQPADRRAAQRERFDRDKQQRIVSLERMGDISISEPLPIGWVQVSGRGSLPDMGTDPDSEKVAIARVWTELDALGYEIDDRQTAGVGYDLYARHRTNRQVRLIEVKGQQGDLAPVTLERHEWEQAQQRGELYWLYVVTACATEPQVFARLQDPANVFGTTRAIQRHQISVTQLRDAVAA